jgi:alpha-mannosidase
LAQPVGIFQYDIPFGVVERPPQNLDVPGNSWGAAISVNNAPAVQIISEGTYGFRGIDNSLALSLIRSSFDPDPYPEVGIHKIRFALAVLPDPTGQDLIANATDYCLPLDVSSAAGGQRSKSGFLKQESGAANLAAIKAPEDGEPDTLILRMYEADGEPTDVTLRFAQPVVQAIWVNVHEQPSLEIERLEIDGDRLKFTLQPYCLRTIRVRFT